MDGQVRRIGHVCVVLIDRLGTVVLHHNEPRSIAVLKGDIIVHTVLLPRLVILIIGQLVIIAQYAGGITTVNFLVYTCKKKDKKLN